MADSAAVVRPNRPASITIAGRQIPFRVCLFWAGVAFWIGNMWVQTGSAAMVALWASFAFLVEMVVLTSATRTIRLSQVAKFCCLGGAMMSVVWLMDYGFTMFQPNFGISREFFTPFVEETMKIAPVAVYVWLQRQTRARSLGASDVFLMAAASGAGFGLVEDAYVQHRFGAWHPATLMPTTAVMGASMTAGHQIWAALAGASLGLALLWRPRKPFAFVLGLSGIVCSMIDHFRNNFGVGRSGAVVTLLNWVGGRGWFVIYLFVIGVIAVLGSDLYAGHEMLTSHPQLKLRGGKPPEGFGQGDGIKGLWAFLMARRSLAYVLFRWQRASGPTKENLAGLAAAMERRLNKPGVSGIAPRKPSAAAAS